MKLETLAINALFASAIAGALGLCVVVALQLNGLNAVVYQAVLK